MRLCCIAPFCRLTEVHAVFCGTGRVSKGGIMLSLKKDDIKGTAG